MKLEKNRGVYVREITEPEAHELYELRASLDEMAGRYSPPASPRRSSPNSRLAGSAVSCGARRHGRLFPAEYRLPRPHRGDDRQRHAAGILPPVIDRMHLLRRRNFSSTMAAKLRRSSTGHRRGPGHARPAVAAATMRAHVPNGYRRLNMTLPPEIPPAAQARH